MTTTDCKAKIYNIECLEADFSTIRECYIPEYNLTCNVKDGKLYVCTGNRSADGSNTTEISLSRNTCQNLSNQYHKQKQETFNGMVRSIENN